MTVEIAEAPAPAAEAPNDPTDIAGVADWLQAKQEAEPTSADDESAPSEPEPPAEDEPQDPEQDEEPDDEEDDEGDPDESEDESETEEQAKARKSRSAQRRERKKQELAEAREKAEKLEYELQATKTETKHLQERVNGWQEHAQTWEVTARSLKAENDHLRQLMEQNGVSEDPRDQELRRMQSELQQVRFQQEQAQVRAQEQADAQMRAEIQAAGVQAMQEAKRYGVDAQEVMRTWGAHKYHNQNIPISEVARMVAFRHGKLGPQVMTAEEIRAQQAKNQAAPVTQRHKGTNANAQFSEPTVENGVAYLQSRGVI